MKHRTFLKKLKFLSSQRNLLAVCLIVLSFSVLHLTHALKNKEERIIVYPTHGVGFWIEKSAASPEYLRRMGVFISDFFLTRTPADVSYKNEQILQHVHPRYYSSFKKQLEEDAESLKKKGISFLFETKTIKTCTQTMTFSIEGTQKVFETQKTKQKALLLAPLTEEKVRYTLSFLHQEGRVYITNIHKEPLS